MVLKVFNRIFRNTYTINRIAAPLDKQSNGKKPSDDNQVSTVESGGTLFEDAVKLTGYGKFNHLLMLVCGLSIMSAILEMLNIGYVLSAAACDFKLSQQDKGVLGAITYVGIICSSHTWGVLGDTLGRRRIIIISLLADVVVSTLASLAPTYSLLVLCRFLNGVCVCAASSLAYAYLGEFNTPANRNRVIIFVGLITGCSAVILPGVAWAVLPMSWELPLYNTGLGFKSWRLFLLLSAVPSLTSGLSLLLFFPESPKFLLATGRRLEALEVLQHVYSVNTGRTDFPVREITEDTSSVMASTTDRSFVSLMKIVWIQTIPLFKRPFVLHTFLVCFIQFGNIASASGLLMWLPELFNYQAKYRKIQPVDATICEAVVGVIAHNATFAGSEGVLRRLARAVEPTASTSFVGEVFQELSVPSTSAPACTSGNILNREVYINSLIIGTTNTLVPAFGGLLVNHVGKRNLLICSLWLTGASAISINFVRSYEAILALACVVIAITGMCIAHISSVVVDLYPTHLRAMAVGLSLMCGRLGSMVGNLIFGSLLETRCDASFYFFGGVLVLCGLCALFLPRRGKFAN